MVLKINTAPTFVPLVIEPSAPDTAMIRAEICGAVLPIDFGLQRGACSRFRSGTAVGL